MSDNDDLFNDDSPPAQSPVGPSRSAASDGEDAGLFGDDSPRASPNPLEYAEQDDEAGEGGVQYLEETISTHAIPQWTHMAPSDGKVWHLKLPTYVNVESRPYDVEHYRATLGADDSKDLSTSEAKAKMINVRNTMRWRWVTGPDGEPVRQSNARMLRWSDGSVSMQLGADLFDVAPSHGTTLARASDPTPNRGTTFVGAQVPLGNGLFAVEAAVAGQLSLVPTSMDSKTHMELVRHVEQRHVKHSRMKMLDEGVDKTTYNQMIARANGVAPVTAKAARKVTRKRAAPASGAARAAKRGSDSGSEGYVSDEPRRRAGRERDEPEGEYDEDDGFVVADSDSEDERAASRKKSSKRRRYDTEDEDEDEDEMEAMERKIEEQERRRGKGKKGSKSKDYVSSEEDAEGEPEEEDEEDMDVESEGD